MSATPYSGSEPYVFVSYPREDLDLVRGELDRLAEWGVRIDFATDEEPVDGARLTGADFYLVLVSDSTEDDPHLRKEVSAAIQEGKDGLCVHVFDVPLDGPIKLLLNGLPQVSRPLESDPEHKQRAYLRRIAQALPEEVKSRPIELPGDEQPAAPPPSRSSSAGDGGPGNLVVGGAALGAVALVLGLLYLALFTGEDPSPTPSPGASAEPSLAAKTEAKPRASRRARPQVSATPEVGAAAAAALRTGLEAARAAAEAEEWAQVVEALVALDDATLAADAAGRSEAYLLRAQAYDRLGKLKESAADYDVLVALRPEDVSLRSARGDVRRAAGDTDGALEDLGKVIELSPSNDFAWSARGDLYYALERYEEAIADYTKAVEIQPKSRSGYLKRARARAKAGDDAGAAADREAAYAN